MQVNKTAAIGSRTGVVDKIQSVKDDVRVRLDIDIDNRGNLLDARQNLVIQFILEVLERTSPPAGNVDDLVDHGDQRLCGYFDRPGLGPTAKVHHLSRVDLLGNRHGERLLDHSIIDLVVDRQSQ